MQRLVWLFCIRIFIMARSTFEGPVLAGDSRFGPLRNVGYVDLVQETSIVLTNTTNGTAGYGGTSGQFVNGNQIPNLNAVVYTSSSTAYPPTAATITADSGSSGSGNLYRGVVFYLPYSSNINDILLDTNVAITFSGSETVGTVTAKVGNAFNNTAYGNVTTMNAATGRNTVAQTGAQLLSNNATTGDITLSPGQGTSAYANLMSQVVVTLTIPYSGGSGTTLPTISAGTFTFTIRYTQPDPNIGNTTTYPYGNFD
jgi:hypothetical protein